MGRPAGSTNLPKIRDYITNEEVEGLIKKAKEMAEKDPTLLKFLIEQIFGKARQNIGLDGGETDKPIAILKYVQGNFGDSQNNENGEKDSGDTGGDISEQDNINTPLLNTLGTE